MGDMKTPDFDDLLAAFDIPDIDAKEAIQSSPEEGAGGVGKSRVNVIEGSSAASASPPTLSSDIPVVSVIVKNKVQPDTYEDAEMSNDEDDGDSSEDSDPDTKDHSRVGDALLISQLDSSMTGVGPSEALPQNGLETSVVHQRSSLRGQGIANGELWSPSSPLSSPVSASEGEIEERGVGGSVSTAGHTANIHSRLKPHQTPHSLQSSASLTFPSTSSSSPPSLSFNQRLPLHSNQSEDAPQLCGPLPSLSSNGSSKAGIRHIVDSYEEDSEPDLGSPLVIQESPGSPVSPQPRFQRRNRVPSKKFSFAPQSPPHPLPCPPPLSSSLTLSNPKPRPQEEMPSTTRSPSRPVQAQGPQGWLSSTLSGPAPVIEEKYPEHIIDERDSPESPPPDQTGLSVPKESRSPATTPAPAISLQPPRDGEEAMESEPSQESRTREVKMEKMDVDNGGQAKENTSAGSSSADVRTAKTSAAVSSTSRPLKVKIKTVKTPTGSITRTVTRVAPKAGGGTDGSKPSTVEHKVANRPKRMTAKPMPAFQEASTAMLVAASKAQSKGTADNKPKVSATAVSITKAAALPTISSSPRMSPGGVNVRSLGQKTLTSGMAVSSPSPLLPPQGSSRPASIVNNTGAIISRSQSSLVEAFNKILNSKNLLPCYKPDLSAPLPSEWGLPLPAQGYRCLECGDAFALERSLARHYDRRSLRIEVTCNHCAKRLAFFNKCSLLLHAREHKEKGLVMQCSHLVMKPVTVEQMTGHQDTTPMGILSSSSSLSTSSALSSALTLAATSHAPQLQQQQQRTASKRAETVQHPNSKCPECQAQFGSKDEVVAHFQEIKASGNTQSCTECSPSMLLPNACSASAHQRIHKACAPHVCPECGGVAKQAAFQSHLEEACLHYARRIGYRCSSCQVVFGGLNSVKSHIQTAHCEVFHKCPSCPMAFKSAPGAQNHINSNHPTLSAGQAKMIYKCVMCDTVFTQKALLYVHFDTHLVKQKVHVFKCPECTKLYAQRTSMLDHVRTVHKDVTVKQESSVTATASSPAPPPRARSAVKTESSDGEEWRDQEEEDEAAERAKAKTILGWNCAPCHARYSDRDDYIAHMAEQHGKILKKFPCSQCESSFSSTSSLRRHVRVKHKDVKRVFNCKFCNNGKKTFSSRLVLERHIQLRHGMNADTLQKPGVGTDGADSSSEQDGGPGPGPRFTGAASRKKEEGPAGGSTAKRARVSPEAPPESGFRCSLCGFTTEEQAVFLEHIPQHRTEGAGGLSLQCVQCGACFTSATSLSRHRFITHRVRDKPRDLHGQRERPAPASGNGVSHADLGPWGESPAGSPSSNPLGEEAEGKQPCKVCGKRFEKASDLNTHLRTHGMAFLTARKTDKPT